MAEEIIAHTDDDAELRALLRELAQELSLRDVFEFKNRKLLEGLAAHNDEKAKAIAEEYRSACALINDNAAENMNREIGAMSAFSAETKSFNELCADFLVDLATLKALAGEKE
jgi:phosphoenolpyruvate carboxylase